MINRLLITSILASLVLSLGACNTVRGIGKDLESVADAGDRVT